MTNNQRQYQEYMLQDHCILLLKLIQIIYQQGPGTFRLHFFFRKGRDVKFQYVFGMLILRNVSI